MATQSRQSRQSKALVEAIDVAVAEPVNGEVVDVVDDSSEDAESTMDWRQQLAEQLLEKAKTDGVKLVGPDGLLAGITKAVLETALQTELSDHLGYEKGDPAGRGSPNSRNGSSAKTVHTELGRVRIDVPRDRAGSFTPAIVPKNSRRVGGFDEAIISLYAEGLTTGEVQAHLRDVYGAEISRELVSKVTDAVNDEPASVCTGRGSASNARPQKSAVVFNASVLRTCAEQASLAPASPVTATVGSPRPAAEPGSGRRPCRI